jgi:hypothetical protein
MITLKETSEVQSFTLETKLNHIKEGGKSGDSVSQKSAREAPRLLGNIESLELNEIIMLDALGRARPL